jgi:NAD(P)-dependent dehydrogenase (short-subunit alcohol dehydrogenase family)
MKPHISSMFDLEGKTAVITGGGGDLCSVMSRALSDAGARVAILDISLEKAKAVSDSIDPSGGVARAYACDVLDEKSLVAAYDAIKSVWGTPDILINGAGGNVQSGTTKVEFMEREDLGKEGVRDFFALDFDGVRRTFDLNFLGTFLPSKVFTRGMVEKGSGTVLNIASMGALTPLTQVGAYSAAKAAVANFTAWLAVHFSHTGVRVNALAPGFLMTEQLKFLHIDQATGMPTARARKVMAHTPMGRYGVPDELVGGLLYLVSGASSFVTGIVLPIDGGFSSYSI